MNSLNQTLADNTYVTLVGNTELVELVCDLQWRVSALSGELVGTFPGVDRDMVQDSLWNAQRALSAAKHEAVRRMSTAMASAQ